MKVVRAPDEFAGAGPAFFLAGGITGCPDWQAELLGLLPPSEWTALDPRRHPWPEDPGEVAKQIDWEHRHLRRADLIAFWFPPQTLCPITLYELGAWSMSAKPLVVGVDPGYARRLDVRVQTRLARPDVVLVDSLEALAEAVRARIGPERPERPERPVRP
jgi:hypothetical protein